MEVSKNIVSAEGGWMGKRAGVGDQERVRDRERWDGGISGERLLPLLQRLIKTAPTFLLNHSASQRTKHFYQCLYLRKQWQVGCQGPPRPFYIGAIMLGLRCHTPLSCIHKWSGNTHAERKEIKVDVDAHGHARLPFRVVRRLRCDLPLCWQGPSGHSTLKPRAIYRP